MSYNFCFFTNHGTVVRNVLHNNGTCTYFHIIAHMYSPNNYCSGTNIHIIADYR